MRSLRSTNPQNALLLAKGLKSLDARYKKAEAEISGETRLEADELVELRKKHYPHHYRLGKLDKSRGDNPRIYREETSFYLRVAIGKIPAAPNLAELALTAFIESMDSKFLTAHLTGFKVNSSTLTPARTQVKKAFDELNKREKELIVSMMRQMPNFGKCIDTIKNNQSLLPVEIKRALLAEKPSLTSNDNTQREAVPAPTPSADRLTVIEVDKLLPEGEVPPTQGVLEGIGRAFSDNPPEIRTQPRLDWVISALKDDGFGLGDMILYKEKHVEGFNPEKSQYRVLEVQKDDRHLQIAVSEIVGNATYILRQPRDFAADNAVVTCAELKQDPTVYQTRCYSEAQWLRSIRHYAYTPMEDLSEQLKTKTFWRNLKDSVKESFGEFYLENFQFPARSDPSIVQHGPLAGKTTWDRMYRALGRGAIDGLSHVKDFESLRDEVFGPGCDQPPPAPKEPPVLSFNAQDVFDQAVRATHASGKLPDLGAEFERSIRANKVSNLEQVVSGHPGNITSTSAFLVATGIAVEIADNDIRPAPPAVIAQFMRLIQPK